MSNAVVLPLLDKGNLPQHVAIIMDGNGRWAKERGQDRVHGHYEGVLSVREAVSTCGELGIPYLTLYAFSAENWNRPKAEVDALMELLVNTLRREIEDLKDRDVRLHVIGNLESLPEVCQREMKEAMAITAHNSRLHLILALSYSARWELARASRQLALEVAAGSRTADSIDEAALAAHLTTADFPDPELMIRTSGEHRISNFLLYQLAYAELCFLPVHWPDFRKEHFYAALADYQQRERRFGKTSEQLQAPPAS